MLCICSADVAVVASGIHVSPQGDGLVGCVKPEGGGKGGRGVEKQALF